MNDETDNRRNGATGAPEGQAAPSRGMRQWLRRVLRPRNGRETLRDTLEELIEQYKRKKDQRLVGVLFERYSHLVFGLCLKYLKNEEKSKDAVLHIFETLIQSLLDHEVKYFKSWLFSVSRNHCLMHLRSTSIKQAKQEKIQEHAQFMSIDRSEELEEREMQLSSGYRNRIPHTRYGKTFKRYCLQLSPMKTVWTPVTLLTFATLHR